MGIILALWGFHRRCRLNIGLPQWGLTCSYDSLVLNQSAVLRMSFSANNPPLRQAQNRYRSCYGDSANMKRTTIGQTNCSNMRQQQTQHLRATLQKKNKKNAPARKNSIAYTHCTHLPLPAITQSQPEGKVKRVQSPTLCFAVYIKEHIFLYI